MRAFCAFSSSAQRAERCGGCGLASAGMSVAMATEYCYNGQAAPRKAVWRGLDGAAMKKWKAVYGTVERVWTAAATAAYWQQLISEEKSPRTIEKYRRDIGVFRRYVGNRPVTKALVLAYKAELQARYAARSVNSMLASINSLFSFLGWHDLRVKALKWQQPVFCPEEKELTRAEYTRLCRTAERNRNERLALVLQTICGTGIRVSELQYITVEAVKRSEAVVNCKAKTRSVFIVKELKQKLLRYAAERGIRTGMIFVTRTGKPVSRTNIWREMKALCAEAHVDPQKVFPHNLRHLFARVFYGIEKDIAKLADILGHSSINTTRIYIISTGREHRKQLETMRLIL